MNSLADLNEYLFSALDAITNDDLSDEQLQREINKAQAVTKVAETVIRNGELALKTMQLVNEYGSPPPPAADGPRPGILPYPRRGKEHPPHRKRLLGGGGGGSQCRVESTRRRCKPL